LIADHGPWVVWGVVGSSAYHGASWAGNRLASWVGWVIGHGRSDDNAALCEWVALGTAGVAVDVGEIPVDAVTCPGVLELRDWARECVVGRKLDGDTNTLFTVLGADTPWAKQLHTFSLAVDGRVVDIIVTVVID